MDKDLENKIQNFERDMTKLEEFCKAHETLYIYGAGKIGARYYSLIKDWYKVSGFIVSAEKDCGSFQGLPVISVADLPCGSSNHAGIIPAFKESSAKEIKEKFPAGRVDVFDIKTHDFVSYNSMIKSISFIHEQLKEYGPPAKLPLPPRDSNVNILITRLDAIGDVICTTPLIREVRKNYPNAFITVVIRGQNKELLENCPYIDELLLYDTGYEEPRYMGGGPDYDLIKAKTDAFIKKSFQRKYDIVFKATEVMAGRNMIQELLLVFGSGATWRIGHLVSNNFYKEMVGFKFSDLFSLLLQQYFATHEIIYMLDMLRQCGLDVQKSKPELWPSMDNRSNACNLLNRPELKGANYLVAVGLAGSERKKNWPEDNYKSFFKKNFAQYKKEVFFLLLGGKADQSEGYRLAAECENVLDCTGVCSLNDTVSLMSKCSIYLGSNTGLLHIASAVGINAIVLYGCCLSDEPYIGGGGPCRWEAHGVVNYNLIPPSGLDGCHVGCAKAEPHCITQIEVGQVEMALRCMINLSSNIV